MNKAELLQELSVKVATGEIAREEIAQYLNVSVPATNITKPEQASFFSATKILYILGAAIVVIGIVVFVSQIWDDIGSFGRILVTLGLGLLLTAVGSTLLKSKPEESIGLVFQFMGGMLIPGGAMVTLLEINPNWLDIWPIVFAFGTIFAFYLLLNYVHKNAILTFFAILNGTVFIYALTAASTEDMYYGYYDTLYAYLTMAVGVSYLLLAHAFSEGWNRKLTGALCLFGITGFLGAAFSLVFDSVLWQLLYFIVVMGGLLLSVYMKSRSILVMSTLFLVVHVSYITGEYFADSLGWPLSLVILGFIFIGLGYFSINLNKKYIQP